MLLRSLGPANRCPRDADCSDSVYGQADSTKRLGALRGGGSDVLRHRYFKPLDWDGLLRRSVPAPLVPHVAHPADTANFDEYPDSPLLAEAPDGPPLGTRARECFAQF